VFVGIAPAPAAARYLLPVLPWLAAGLLIGGFVILAGGIVLIAVPLERASRREPAVPQEWQPPQDAGDPSGR